MCLGHHFEGQKVKGQGHQAGLLTAMFTHRQLQRSAWETGATLPSAGAAVGSAARGATAPTRGGEGRGHIASRAHAQLVYIGLTAAAHNR